MVFMHGHLSFERLGSNFLITCSGCLVLFLFVCFFPSCPLLFLDGLQFRGDALATTSEGTPCLLNFLPDLNASMAAGSWSCLALTFYFVFLFPPQPRQLSLIICSAWFSALSLGFVWYLWMIPSGSVCCSKAFIAASWLCRLLRDQGWERPEESGWSLLFSTLFCFLSHLHAAELS